MEALVETYVMMEAEFPLHVESRLAVYLLIEGSNLADKGLIWL